SSGVSVQYVGESVDGQSAVVSTTVLTRSGGEMPVDYSMVQGQGRWLVRDVIIEGVSLIANYRAQFARVIRASSYAALIAKMRGDTDDAPRDRKWVVTVATTPVARPLLVPHLPSSAVAAPSPLAIAVPPAPVAAPPVAVAALPVTAAAPPVAVAAPPVAALPVPTRTPTSPEQSAPL